jgi:hypothetical protein
MTVKTVDLDDTLFGVTEKYPELKDVLFGLGFAGVKNEAMRTSHGRQMTLRAGCSHMGMDLGAVTAALKAAGFEVKP